MRLDRLGALLGGIAVGEIAANAVPGPSVWVEAGEGVLTLGLGLDCPVRVLVAAQLQWGASDVMLQGGPYRRTLCPNDPLHTLAGMLVDEVRSPRCGATSLLSGYAEVLLIHLLRDVIGGDGAGSGLMGGLADPKLSRALVAIHENPARGWSAELLAGVAGMSRSAFMDRFRVVVGQAPMAYLRAWRMHRAADALAQGGRISVVARRFGYRSGDAFSRAFRAQFGCGPSDWRKARVTTPAKA
tara:strand:+ start:7047 stop:7772 length:726 start_codon:yes stop_codon:yes gene_type:complete